MAGPGGGAAGGSVAHRSAGPGRARHDGPEGDTTAPEVFKAGRWDRARGDGGGFAAGGVADDLPPGPALAGFAGDAWTAGLGRLSDDELIGVLRASGASRRGPPPWNWPAKVSDYYELPICTRMTPAS